MIVLWEWYSLHVCKKVDSVSIIVDRGIADDTQGMQLVAQSSFTNDKLSGVGSVEAVDAIGPCYPVLHAQLSRLVSAIAKESCSSHHIFRGRLQRANNILISTDDHSAQPPSSPYVE